ncbi:MAG: DNA mismatch repair protein MutS [Ruminiclostridium sp.]|nr:DNA mismatch repair protein MutS [Ruminiclostridium sp.]
MAAKIDPEKKPTPMLEQYLKVREEYKDCVLFYRLGDFYEMFYDDAENISKELELTLTSRAGVPMCGVPYHAVEQYVKRLIDKGYKVAICEQMEDPALAKGLVERGVIRVVTPGTLYEDSMLDEGRNNYIASFFVEKDVCGMVFADISTGEFHAYEKRGKTLERDMIAEISRYVPSELLFNESFMDCKDVNGFIHIRMQGAVGSLLDDTEFSLNDGNALISQYFDEPQDASALEKTPLAKKALFAVFRYINETQKAKIRRSVRLTVHFSDDYMNLGITARRNLELTETMRNGDRKGSLMWVIDKTKTAMGRRKLRRFIEQPLLSATKVLERLDAVERLFNDYVLLEEIRDCLSGIFDLERLITRVVYRAAGPRDVVALGKTCGNIPLLKTKLAEAGSAKLIAKLDELINPLTEIATLVDNAIVDSPPALTKDGGYIRDGFNEELDRLRKVSSGGKEILADIEAREREATGIKNLRVGYNRVFGYYIEVSKGNIPLVPETYIRKQTLANGERYITEELKKTENEILGANDKILALEAEIFAEVRDFISSKLEIVQRTADAIAYVDVLQSFAAASLENNFVRPDISLEGVIDIKDGRHPVIEKIRSDTVFTPNDAYLDTNENKLLIITGPNMAGKSTFMRQVAVITLMAQIGCFVPARSARIGIVDKIFTRVGASDDLAAGQSTFMVEMNEVAEILKNATKNSLVILDEIGRGTSTFDGMSIAKATAEYINGKIGCKTLFATHYHELTALEKSNKGVRNYSVAVMKKGDDIKFLHKIVEGGTDNSYGIEVAKLAGLPSKVIENAKTALKDIELGSKIDLEKRLNEEEEQKQQYDFSAIAKNDVIQAIKNLDLDDMSPRDAYARLAEFKEMLK